MIERDWIAGAALIYAGAFLYSLYVLHGRVRWESRTHRLLVAAGWLAHTYGLYVRAARIGYCPLTNHFEVMMFITWALVLTYLAIGLIWRVSLLGEFTLPLVIALCVFGLFPGLDKPRAEVLEKSLWLSMHASIALLSYGALGLAGITGVMYLMQERLLKQRRLRGLFERLPSIQQLDVINFRLLLVGLAFLTLGIVFGFVAGAELVLKDVPKTIWSFGVWAVYAVLLWASWTYRMRGRKIALGSVASFAFVLATFWMVNLQSGQHRF
jgi:ABC-type uncharacterized transport system permease subunit